MQSETIAVDPLGKSIYLSPEVLFIENGPDGIYDDATIIIQRPAMLIEVNENEETQFYYFRSIGWNRTLLIIVRWNQNRWEAYKCLKNPSGEMLSVLLKKGIQIF